MKASSSNQPLKHTTPNRSDLLLAMTTSSVIPAVLFLLFFVIAVFCGMHGGSPGLWTFVVVLNILLVTIMHGTKESAAMVTSVVTLSGSCFAWMGTLLSLKYDLAFKNIDLLADFACIAFLVCIFTNLKTTKIVVTMCSTWFTAYVVSEALGTSESSYTFEIIFWFVAATCWLQARKLESIMPYVGAMCAAVPAAYFVGALARAIHSN